MKLAIISIACVVTLSPQAMGFSDACRQSLVYCGSTLIKYNGYTPDEIHQAVASASSDPVRFAALLRPEDARFTCINTTGGIALKDFCAGGCTNPPNGDTCL
ncbi:hypothetical protein BJX62DRAFT_215181 [Aspergillus germanicus]